MKFFSKPFLIASAATLLLAGTEARAAFVSWTYNWSRLPTDVISADANGTSRISLSDEPIGYATGSSDIVATNIKTFSNAPVGTPNNFTDVAYALTLTIKDEASGQGAIMNFGGTFAGPVSANGSKLTTKFGSPTKQVAELGGNLYEVTLDAYSPPGPPGITNSGSIAASVIVTPKADPDPIPPAPNDVPEPSTVLLSLVGVTGLGMASWRRWRQRRLLEALA